MAKYVSENGIKAIRDWTKEHDNKSLYNLGAYDTISGNVITRQTGYIVLDGVENKFYGKSSSTSNGIYYTGVVAKYIEIPSSESVVGNVICNRFETYYFYKLYDNNIYGIAIVNNGNIAIGLTTAIDTLDKANAYLVQNPISIQYKLATATTEKVEKNHYARYNQDFILEHNKSEAERSANLLDDNLILFLESSCKNIDYPNFLPLTLKAGTYTLSYSGITKTSGTWLVQLDNEQVFSKDLVNTSITFTCNTEFKFKFYCGANMDGAKFMLNEGDHSYPYQAYNGEIVHDKDIADLYKQEYNLGYYDTMVANSDGTYTITRQTGYVDLGSLHWIYDPNNNQFYSNEIDNAYSENSTWIPVVCNTYTYNIVDYNDLPTPHIRGFFDKRLYVVDETLNQNGELITGVIQYKLKTATTEKVEKNHYATYNQNFILEHNKSEAERSANLWKGGNLSYRVEYDGYQVFDVSNINALVGDTITINFKSNTYNDVLKFLPAIGQEGYVSNINGTYTITFTLSSGSNKLFYISGHVGENISFYDIQVNKGSVVLPYQPYEGKVVHEKDLDNKFGTFVTTDTPQTIPAYKKFNYIGVNAIQGAESGNAILRQIDTGDVIVGSTLQPLRLWGNGDRPTYSKDDGASYKNLALLSDIPGIATSSAAGLVKSSTTGTTSNRDYNVQVNSNGTMKVNVPWTDNNTWRPVVDNLTSTATDQSLSANQGKVLKGLVDGKAAASHTHSYLPLSGGDLSGIVRGGAIDVHPENGGTIIGYYTNDLAYILKRGGTCVAKNVTQSTSIAVNENWFDASPSYGSFTVTAVTDVVQIIIRSPVKYSWGTSGGIGFGAAAWRAKNVKVELGYSATNTGSASSPDSDIVWVTRINVTNNSQGLVYTNNFTGPSVSEGGTSSTSWSYIRITLTDWNNTTPRIAQIFSVNFGSAGMHNAFLSRSGGTVYGTITPYANNSYYLGSSTNKWAGVYATTFNENGTTLADKYAAKSHTHTKSQITDFPTIPTVNNPTITINQGGTKKGSFTLNQSGNTTIDLTDNNTTYSIATASTAGLVKSSTTGTTSNRDYKVQVNTDGTMKVNVPWTDNNTTYTAGTGLSLSSGAFSVKTGYTTSGKNYKVTTDSNGNLYVNVPWTDNNTTYTAGTGLSLSGTTFSVSSANVSTMMNLLSEGTSDPTDNDYYISQWVGGGTTTTTYHRRPVSKLYNYMKGKFDSIYQAKGSYAASSHTHNYAGSSSAGGAATSAAKLTNTSAIGSSTQPVYFSSSGVPVACTYTLGKSVPSDAKFTDTNTWRPVVDNLTSTATDQSLSANQGKVLKGLVDGKAAASHTHNYLPLSGGTMTGPIYYQGTHNTYPMIKWINNTSDAYGNGIRIGGGGATIIGGGESSDLPNVNGGDEVLYLMNDGAIDFYSNCQEGLSSAKHMTFDVYGTLNVPTNVVGSSNSNRLIFRHLDGQNCNGDYNLYLQYHQQTSKIYLNGSTYYIENGYYYNGISEQANLINPHQNISSTGRSTWSPSGTGKVIWGQNFVNNTISNDTGDLVLSLRPSVYSSGNTELCMHIDGDYYSNGNKVLHSGNFVSGNSDNGEHNANNAITNGHYYYNSNGPSTSLGASTNDGALYVQSYSSSWVGQIAQDYRNGSLFVRGKNNGSWQSWKRIVDSKTPGVFTLLNSRATNVSLSLDKTYLVIAYTGPVRVYGENSDYGSSGSKTFSGVFMVTVVRAANEGESVYVNTQAVFSDEYLTGASISGSSFKIYELK